MGETKKKQEMKYDFTPELRAYIQEIRNYFQLSTEVFSQELGMKKETYTNIEKPQSRTTLFTRELFEKIFSIFQAHSPYEQNISLETYILGHLEKFMYNANTNKRTLNNQHWLKALHLRYSTVHLNDTVRNALLPYDNYTLREKIIALKDNRHIKLKTDITLTNEVYIDLREDRYPPLGDYPFWCVKYADFTDEKADKIIDTLEYQNTIDYTLLFSLMVNDELESRRKKDYNDVYATVYRQLNSYGISNVFDKIKKIVGVEESNTQEQEQPKAAEVETVKNDFIELLKTLDTSKYTEGTQNLITNCIKGGDSFIDSINVDFTALLNGSATDKQVFKLRLIELLEKI